MATGLLLIAAALFLLLSNQWEERQAGQSAVDALRTVRSAQEAASAEGTQREGLQVTAAPESADAAQPTELPQPSDGLPMGTPTPPDYVLHPEMEMPTVEADGERYVGTLEIPVLSLTLPVISEWSYPRLKKSPCRFSGSAYMDDLIIIAHNYKTHFGLLKKLLPGDEVIFTDMAGNAFHYQVAETEILRPTQIDDLTETDYPLTLLTCTVGGRTRVTVRCDRVGE